jgi:hypothetical protein
MESYVETKARIQRERMLPWASCIQTKIAGFPVNQLSLSSLVDLEIGQNFIVTGKPNENLVGDVLAYLWRHSVFYKNNPNWFDKRRKNKLLKEIAKNHDIVDIAEKCKDHFEYTMDDSPVNKYRASKYGGSFTMSASPSVAYIIDEVCSEYNLKIAEAMEYPLKKIFQLMRCIRIRKMGEGRGGKVSYAEPKELTEVIKRQLKELNAKNNG